MAESRVKYVFPERFTNSPPPTREQDLENLEAHQTEVYAAIARHCGLGGGRVETKEELLYGFANLLYDIQCRLHSLKFGEHPDEIRS